MLKKILFIDRDEALISERDEVFPTDGVILALARLQASGYELVMLRQAVEAENCNRQVDTIRLFQSQGIRFLETLHCPHSESEKCICRKPHLGLVKKYLTQGELDTTRSAVIGQTPETRAFAQNLGLNYLGLESGWKTISETLIRAPRIAKAERRTAETKIQTEVNLDSPGNNQISTGLGFFDHMLEQLAKHGGFSLKAMVVGDLMVDEHHTVEDTAICIGEALRRALGDKIGIGRYGFLLPMDETECQVSLDLSGRAYLKFEGTFPRDFVGELPTELVPHFYRSLSEALGANLHISVRGENAHHMVESTFKAVGRALRPALAIASQSPLSSVAMELPSTKGKL